MRGGIFLILVPLLAVLILVGRNGIIPQMINQVTNFVAGGQACTQIGSSGTIPDFAAGDPHMNRYWVWLQANPPCIPSGWMPAGCSYLPIGSDKIQLGFSRYPYVYDGIDIGSFSDVIIHSTRQKFEVWDTSSGIQVIKCADGFHGLYFAYGGGIQISTSGAVPVDPSAVTHEVSAALHCSSWRKPPGLVEECDLPGVVAGRSFILTELRENDQDQQPMIDRVYLG